MAGFEIHPDITRAWTPPARIYHDAGEYARQVDRIFARSWHLGGDADRLKAPGRVVPFTLLPGCLDEPLVWVRDDGGTLRCLSNVCTHRGTLVVEGEGHLNQLRCRYHGRRFTLDGRFKSMPEFDDVVDFPSPGDDLRSLPTARWGPLLFCALDPLMDFDEWIGPVRERVGFLPIESYAFDADTSRDYHIDAHWALYCDNYLEEFHIPYVHAGSLGGKLSYADYRTDRFRWGSVQIGAAAEGEPAFDLPAGHPDEGTRVAAYYFWLFPNLMLNFYPWGGLSVNIVEPRGPERCTVRFLTYARPGTDPARAGAYDLHRVEMEDEEVVEAVQQGVRSRLYDRGRYSPRRETGTHHFHRMLAERLSDDRIDPAASPHYP